MVEIIRRRSEDARAYTRYVAVGRGCGLFDGCREPRSPRVVVRLLPPDVQTTPGTLVAKGREFFHRGSWVKAREWASARRNVGAG